MTPQNRNRLIAVVALVAAAGGLSFVAFGKMNDNLVYYWTPGQMIAHGDTAYGASIRLGGIVKKGSVQWNPEHTQLTFQVADGMAADATAVKVSATELPPQMFREGIGVVVEGTFDRSQVFTANRLMVKHSNEYRAPKQGEKHEDWAKTVAQESK